MLHGISQYFLPFYTGKPDASGSAGLAKCLPSKFASLTYTVHASERTHTHASAQASTHTQVSVGIGKHRRKGTGYGLGECIGHMADKATVAHDGVEIGPFTLDNETLTGLTAQDANKNGIVLANERRKFLVKHGDRFVTYTLSAYIQREPLDDDESARVEAAAKDRQAKADAKAKQTAEERERAIKASFEMGQQATMNALQNIGALAAGAQALNALRK